MRTGFENARIDLNSLLAVKVTADVEKQIVAENARYRLTKAVLNSHYILLMNYLLLHSEPSPFNDYKAAKKLDLQRKLFVPAGEGTALTEYEESLQKWRFLFTYAFTSLLRVTMKSAYPAVLRHLRHAAKADIGISLWLLESFSHPRILSEFLIVCPVPETRFFVASLLSGAFAAVFAHERRRMRKYVDDPKRLQEKLAKKAAVKSIDLAEDAAAKEATREAYFLTATKCGLPITIIFANNLLALFPRALASRQSIAQYGFLMASITKGRGEMISYMLQNGVTGLLLEVLTELHGDHVVQTNKQRLVVLDREPSLGFQRAVANDKDRQRTVQVAYIRPKQFRFLLDLLATVYFFSNAKIAHPLLPDTFRTTAANSPARGRAAGPAGRDRPRTCADPDLRRRIAEAHDLGEQLCRQESHLRHHVSSRLR